MPLALAILTACTGSPVRVAGTQESAVYSGTPAAAAGQVLLLRRADGSPLDGATVDLGGKLTEVKNGRLVVPAEIWQRASAAGGLVIAVPGFVPARAAPGTSPALPLILIAYASASELAPLTSPIQTGDKGLTLTFPGQVADAAALAGVGLYHVPVGVGAATPSLGVSVVVEGATLPPTANVAFDLDRMLKGWDGSKPEPWTVTPAGWSAAQIEEAQAARRILDTFVAIDAGADAAARRDTLERDHGITLDGHVLRLVVGLTGTSGSASTVSSVASDVLGVRVDVSVVTMPKAAATVGLAPSVIQAVQPPVIAEKPTPTSSDVTLGGFPVSQAVLTLPDGKALRPDNGPAALADFDTGTSSVLAKAATGLLANTVVDLRTGTTVQAKTGERLVEVVERENGGTIVANNGVSILSNHGGGVISDNGGAVKPADDGNHDLDGGYIVAYPYAPFAPPQPKFQLLALGVPTAPDVRVSAAGLREWLWPGLLQARAIAITGEALSDWTMTDNNGRFALALPPAMPLLFFLESKPAPNVAVQPFHEYSLVFAPRGRVSLAAMDSSTSYNSIPFIYLTTYVDEQTTSNTGALAALQSQLSSLQSQLSSLQSDPNASQSQIDAVQAQINQIQARIAAIQALIAYLQQLERELDASRNQLDVTSVFRFLQNPAATSIIAAPGLKDSYEGLKAECVAQSFTPLSYPLVNLP